MTVPVVTDNPTLLYIEGDGIGPEIWRASQQVFDTAVRVAYENARAVNWVEVLAGEKAYRLTGEWLPQRTIDAIREHKIAIKGPLGTPTGGGHRSLNVTMRQELDLYVCQRPIRWFKGAPSPVKYPGKVNMVIFRENTEDIYSGIEWEAGTPEVQHVIKFLREQLGVTGIRFPDTSAIGVKHVSVDGSKRLIRAAIEYALSHNLTTVTLVHKGNIQKFTEGGFRKWGYELAQAEYADQLADGSLVVNDIIADNFFQQVLLRPEVFQVVALTNLNGDYASDAVAAQVGGIGISPGANLNPTTGTAIFEATHGTAPDIAGKNLANPCSLLLSGAMMFEQIGWVEVSELIVRAIEIAMEQGRVTGDLAYLMEKDERQNVERQSTTGFTDMLRSLIRHLA